MRHYEDMKSLLLQKHASSRHSRCRVVVTLAALRASGETVRMDRVTS